MKNLILPANALVMCLAVTLVNANCELFSYKDSALVGNQQYNLSTLHRGLFGTPNIGHNIGDLFARLDQASATFQYDASYYGKTIHLKFTSFNTLGGREQELSAVTDYSFVLTGSGAGVIDLSTGITRSGLGSIPNSWSGGFSAALTTSSITISWSGTVARATLPTPSQPNRTIVRVPYVGSVVISGLATATQYWFYPYIDDSQAGSPLLFVTNASVGGAIGTPSPIAYTSLQPDATIFAARNDHVPLVSDAPLTFTTTASGSGSGSGGGTEGPCPRADMVVEHRERGVIDGRELVRLFQQDGEAYIWGQHLGVDTWVRVKKAFLKKRSLWVEMNFACGEDIVVSPAHEWKTERGIVQTNMMTLEDIFVHRESGSPVLNGMGIIRDDEQDCLNLEVDSPDHAYYLGEGRPVILSQNGIQPPTT